MLYEKKNGQLNKVAIAIAKQLGGNANVIKQTAEDWVNGTSLTLDKTWTKYGSYGFVFQSNMLLPQNSKSVEPAGVGIHNSFAMAKIVFTVLKTTNITVNMYQNSEQNYDYGFLSLLDTELTENYNTTDTNGVNLGGSGGYQYGSKGKTDSFSYTFENVTPGEHFITIKYRKDGSASNGVDYFSIVSINSSVKQIIKEKKWTTTGEDIDILNWADESIPTPTETITITDNGTYDVTNKASAVVNVAGGGGSGYTVDLLYNQQSHDSDIYFKINGVDNKVDVVQDGKGWYKFPPMSNVMTLSIRANHFGRPFGTSESWFRIRPKGTSEWHTLSENEVYTLTADCEMEFGFGACLLKGTLITMADGTKKPIEEIQVGDYVMGYDKKPKRVYRCQYGQKLYHDSYDVWFLSNGDTIKTCLKHEFYNAEKQRFCYLTYDEDVENKFEFFEHFVNELGEEVKLEQVMHCEIACQHYSLWCDDNVYYANGYLCGNRHSIEIKTRNGGNL